MNKTKNYIQKCICYAIILCLLLCMWKPIQVSAAEMPEKKVIRVGSPESIYDDVNEKGEHFGFGYEYLQKIANYTGWTYEYVPCTWNDCFEKLQNGEIDILEAISYTDERAETMAFSAEPMSEEKYCIFAELGDTDLSLSNLSSFQGKNIGVLKDHLPEIVLDQWTEKNNLKMNYVNITTKEQTIERMEKHETDCYVSVEASYWGEYGMAPVATIGSSGVYFTFRKDSSELKAKLDDAMLRISEDYPFFSSDLYKKYFSDTKIPILTKEEKKWLNDHGTIRIGYRKDEGAVSTLHTDTGEVTGIISDFVREAKDCFQGQNIDFELVGYDSRPDMSEALNKGEIDMIFYVTQNLNTAEKQGYDLSNTTWSTNMAAITAKDFFDAGEENSVAIIQGRSALKSYISSNYPKWNFEEYENMDEAVKAVRKGKTDCIVVESNDAATYTKNGKLKSFVLSEPNNASFAVKHGNITMLSILNKVLETTSTSKITGLLNMYNNDLKKVTVADFLRDNILIVSLIIAIIFLIMLLLLRDALNAKKKATEAMKQAEAANKAKTAFLNNMSHDIRTPINGIVGLLKINQDHFDDIDFVKENYKKMQSSADHLLSLINDVLEMSKIEDGNVALGHEFVDFREMSGEIDSIIESRALEHDISLEFKMNTDKSYPCVYGSPVHLRQIFLNIYGNCIKYNRPGGTIATTMELTEITDNRCVYQWTISDTGIGMSKEFLERIFEPFVQEKNDARTIYQGVGLGMSITKSLIETMGGSIKVSSEEGVGSTFVITIPFEIAKDRPKAEVSDAISIKGLHLLIAEDNELNVEIARTILGDENTKVTVATDGQQAVDLFREQPEDTFDAILMDVMMPVMDGLTATKKIRELDRSDAKTIPIIAMTANAFEEDKKNCLEAGMDAHLAKPLDIENVKRTLYKFIDKK